MVASNKELVQQFIEQVWNQQRLDRVGEFIAPDYAVHLLGNPEPVRGAEAVLQAVQAFHNAFPDWRDTIDDLIAEGDRVVMRWTSGGTHRGTFAGVPPTERPVTLNGIDIFRIERGRIAEHWSQADMAGFVKRLKAADTTS